MSVVPESPEAERDLLGALLGNAEVALACMNGHHGADLFWSPANALVYTAITQLAEAGAWVDVGVVHDKLRDEGLLDRVGGHAGLLDAVRLEDAPPPETAGQHAERLAELRRRRRLIETGTSVARAAEQGDVPGALRRMTHALVHEGGEVASGVRMVDWSTLWDRDRLADWEIEPVLPRGKAINLFAPRGVGKSELALDMAAAKASGRALLDQPAAEPVSVVYLDLEMGEDDLVDRLTDLGYGPGDDLSTLHYACLPHLPAMNTAEGGLAVLDLVRCYEPSLLVVDTLARVAEGEENSNDTWIGLATHCLLPLKAAGVTSLWLGHAGKDIAKGERGGSAKGDAVDCIWQQTRGDGGSVKLTNHKKRAGWVPDIVNLHRTERGGLVAYEMAEETWAAGTNDAAAELHALGAPLDISRRGAEKLLREAGRGFSSRVVGEAIKYRRRYPSAAWLDGV